MEAVSSTGSSKWFIGVGAGGQTAPHCCPLSPGQCTDNNPGPPSPAPGQSYKLNNNKNLHYIKLVAQSLEASLTPGAWSTHRPPKPALGRTGDSQAPQPKPGGSLSPSHHKCPLHLMGTATPWAGTDKRHWGEKGQGQPSLEGVLSASKHHPKIKSPRRYRAPIPTTGTAWGPAA